MISAAVGFIAVPDDATLKGLVLMQAIRRRLTDGLPSSAAAVKSAVSRLRTVLTTARVAVLDSWP